MSSATISQEITVGDDVVGDHVNKLLQVCFLRPCSEEGSDAALSIVKNNNRINRLWQLCRNENGNKSTCRFLAWPVAILEMEIGKLQVRLHDIMDGSSLARAIHVPTGPLQINQHSIRSFTSVQMLHTLDKNGSLYDPAGTES